MPWFHPPIVYDNPTSYPPGTERRQPFPVDASTNRLFSHFNKGGGRARGRSVLRLGGTYVTLDYPTTTQCAEATEVYLGGHVYEVSDAVSSALQAAGFTVYADPSLGPLVHGEPVFPAELDVPSLLTEAGDVLVTEGGDRLMFQGA